MAVPVELREVADRARPVTLARERTLPVDDALAPLLPDHALARGSVVATAGPGATSLALALAAGPSRAGSWTVVVGLPELGLAAAAELGVDTGRLALVDVPDGAWAEVVAALVGGVDLVLVDGRAPVRAGEGRRLASRARERGSVLVPVLPGPARVRRPGAWPLDVTLRADRVEWEGLGAGHGHLRRRRLHVTAEGRGRSARPRRAELWLPSPAGAATPAGSTSAAPSRSAAGSPPRRLRSVG